MADSGTLERPRQVTFAGILAATGCLLLVVSLFDAMELVRSSEMRDDVTRFLAEPPGDGLGLSVDGALRLLRGVVLLAGALAAAGAVFGVYVLQRHRGARLGLSIVAALLLLLSMSQLVGVLPALVAAAATLLWTREGRAWFDGRVLEPVPESERRRPRAERPDAFTPSDPQPPAAGGPGGSAPTSQELSAWAPPAVSDRIEGPAHPADPDPGYVSWQPTAASRPQDAVAAPVATTATRPRAVAVAVLLTLFFSTATALILAGSMVRALADKDGVFRQLQEADPEGVLGGTANEVLRVVLVIQVVGILWCLAAIGLALAAHRRADAARIALVVSSLIAALLALISLVAAFPIPLPHLAATVAVAVLLLTPSANGWFSGRARREQSAPREPRPRGPKPPVW